MAFRQRCIPQIIDLLLILIEGLAVALEIEAGLDHLDEFIFHVLHIFSSAGTLRPIVNARIYIT